MIIITGAAGFIGSCLVSYLNRAGRDDLILVDDFSQSDKYANLEGKKYHIKLDRTLFPASMEALASEIDFVLHIGARTDTTEKNEGLLQALNTDYSKAVWQYCTTHRIPLIYASSAATYGAGEQGYSDAHAQTPGLHPLNPYGQSKQLFDEWVLEQTAQPPFWAGLKFFNVFGPNEYHKGRMASVVLHAFHQFRESGSMRLFRSHRPEFQDGYQLRDFIYVKDLLDVTGFLMKELPASGIYNLGTGKARAFIDLARATAAAMQVPLKIEWVDIPEDIRETYQYFTEADMSKLRQAGYQQPFTSLEAAIEDYVRHYLNENAYY